uniref:Protein DETOXIFICATION n=1 Tax=Oryza punctata TaxID=4537 RepID=A0A0E0KAK0_ORYPU
MEIPPGRSGSGPLAPPSAFTGYLYARSANREKQQQKRHCVYSSIGARQQELVRCGAPDVVAISKCSVLARYKYGRVFFAWCEHREHSSASDKSRARLV